jgi:hypothetical protein
MDLARASPGVLRVWRGFFPLVACFQQLMRGEEAYNLSGANVELEGNVLRLINVKAKNHRYVVDSFYIFLFLHFFLPFFFFRFGYGCSH